SHVRALAVLTNGELASGSFDKTIKIWNPKDGTVKRTLKAHFPVWILISLPNGDLVSGSNANSIIIWNPINGTLKKELISHTNWIRAFAVFSNEDLASGSVDKTVKIWNPRDGTLKRTFSTSNKERENHTNELRKYTSPTKLLR
ncbi:unnamed protein product, partial [Didymodactylos carnosus]